ncbi:MAG TPA: MFS transporter [Gammaproteobacteria bacterium]
MSSSSLEHARPGLRAVPRGVWVLGLVSLFMDVSSEMIHALLPVFLVSVLGASVAVVGWLEGVAEAVASITKVFSGALSDRLGKRKGLTVLGYGLAAVTKPFFALAPSVAWVFAARFADRIGKGIRGAPRDALIADLSPPEAWGASYGLRQSLDTVGAFAGPLLAIALMAATQDDFRTVFWLAVIPAGLSVLTLVLFVREPERPRSARPTADLAATAGAARGGAGYSFRQAVRRLSRRYWLLLLVAALFTLARFSEAFLVLKASEVGLRAAYVPLVLVVMNVVYSLSAYPAGVLSDRANRWLVLAVGSALLIAADLVLAWSGGVLSAMIGIALWGLHMGFTQGLFAALVADASDADERGTAFGVFNLVTGIVLLVASVIAGAVWDAFGSAATFMVGAGLTLLAALVAVALHLGGLLEAGSRR